VQYLYTIATLFLSLVNLYSEDFDFRDVDPFVFRATCNAGWDTQGRNKKLRKTYH